MSFPIPESHLGMAEDRGVSAGIAKFAYHWLNGKLGQWILYRLVLPRADHVFVQSDQMKIDVARLGIPACRMTPVPMAVDTAALATPMATSNSPTCGHSNSPRQDGRIMGFLTPSELIARVPMLGTA